MDGHDRQRFFDNPPHRRNNAPRFDVTTQNNRMIPQDLPTWKMLRYSEYPVDPRERPAILGPGRLLIVGTDVPPQQPPEVLANTQMPRGQEVYARLTDKELDRAKLMAAAPALAKCIISTARMRAAAFYRREKAKLPAGKPVPNLPPMVHDAEGFAFQFWHFHLRPEEAEALSAAGLLPEGLDPELNRGQPSNL